MVADWFISNNKFSITVTRKILNTVGQFGPAICLAAVSFTGCNRVLTVFLLTVGISLNGGIYSGFKVSHWSDNHLLQYLGKSLKLQLKIKIKLHNFADQSFGHIATLRWNINGDKQLFC